MSRLPRLNPQLSKMGEKIVSESFSLWEKVARQRRMRAARPTIRRFCKIVGRAALIAAAPPSPKGRGNDTSNLESGPDSTSGLVAGKNLFAIWTDLPRRR